MVGQAQRLNADNVRARGAQARAAKERGDTAERDRRVPKQASVARATPIQPPPLPLDEAETDLCERLTGLLSKAPKRCCEDVPAAQITVSDRIATAAEVVPGPAELPPLVDLPDAIDLPDAERTTSAPAMKSIKWVKGARRERLKSALGYSTAWLVTIGVIGATVVGAAVLTLGTDKTSSLAAKASQHGAQAATTAMTALRLMIGQ